MNWVGGSRKRLVMKNDAKKQREFFEKRKMQQRLKNLGIVHPATPQDTSSGSMDLVTLFIVNQIAAKKENKGPPKVAVLGSCKGGSKHKRNEPLVLPMSPCSPSQLSLAESQAQYSVHGTGNRKHVIPHGFRCRQLSPVLESAFSDSSASHHAPPTVDPISPLSSISSASSSQGMVPPLLHLQQRSQIQAQIPAHCSPLPWDTSGLEKPFFQARGISDSIPWSCGSNPPLYHLETPAAAKVLFGSSEPDNTEARDHARHEATFFLNQSEVREPMLDFTLNQSETEKPIVENVFRGFSTEECETEEKSKIYLKDEVSVKSSAPQLVPDSQFMAVELSNCTDTQSSRPGHNSDLMNGYNCSPSYSCRGGYLSSDSNDEEQCCHSCLQPASSYMDQACYADSPNSILGPQGNLNQTHSQPRLPTPLHKSKMSFRYDEKLMETSFCPVKNQGCNNQQISSHTAQFDSPQALAQTQSSETCKCKKTPNETQDAGTQTVGNPTADTCDASTQCSFVVDSGSRASGFTLWLPPVDVSVQRPATGRQADAAAEPNARTPSPGEERREAYALEQEEIEGSFPVRQQHYMHIYYQQQ